MPPAKRPISNGIRREESCDGSQQELMNMRGLLQFTHTAGLVMQNPAKNVTIRSGGGNPRRKEKYFVP